VRSLQHRSAQSAQWTQIGASSRIVLLTAATMVLALLLCPAVNRVVRVQRLDQSTSYTPSFQRSLDVPPKPHVVLRDTQVVLLSVIELPQPCTVRWQRPADELLPPLLAPASPRSLRAPPAA